MESVWSSWRPAGLQADSRLTFSWVTTREKIRKNCGWTLEYVGECKVLMALPAFLGPVLVVCVSSC